MKIRAALPPALYNQALARSRSPEWLLLRDEAIALIKEWCNSSLINQKKLPALWFGYGKDGMAVYTLLKMAEAQFSTINIHNGGDIAGHSDVFREFDAWAKPEHTCDIYTPEPYIDVLARLIEDGRSQGVMTYDDQELNFFDIGEMEEFLKWEVLTQFLFKYAEDEDDVLYLWGNRAIEESDRAEELSEHGKIYLANWTRQTYYRFLPIADWSDLDVWALLALEDVPVSPIYGKHKLPQFADHPFPRTIWYCTPGIMDATFKKWLAYYSPDQLKELCDRFPEIRSL